ncbi:MAG: hypothetical protein QM820_06070 [Minicystis sp.]
MIRIVTWNMQGATNAPYIAQVVRQTQANVLCLQECSNLGTLLQAAMPVPGFAGSLTGNFVVGHGFMECIYWKNNAWGQGSLAVMSNVGFTNQGILAPVAAPYVPPAPRGAGRRRRARVVRSF